MDSSLELANKSAACHIAWLWPRETENRGASGAYLGLISEIINKHYFKLIYLGNLLCGDRRLYERAEEVKL